MYRLVRIHGIVNDSLLLLLLLQACGLHNQVANDLGTLTEGQV